MSATTVFEDAPITVSSRQFGGVLTDKERFKQPEVPRIFGEIRDYLRTQSAVLKLDESADRDTILQAYRDDLEMLKSTLDEFEDFGKKAVRYSIVEEADHDIDQKVEKIWDKLQERIPEVGHVPLLQLSAEQAGKRNKEMLAYLRDDFEAGIDRLTRRMSYWLQLLVEEDLIGLVQWSEDTHEDVCYYHYFRQELDERVVETQQRREFTSATGGDVIRDETREQRFSQERHTHHVIDATPQGLGEYTRKVPERVADFIASVPDWLTPHLRIVDGTCIQREVVEEKAGEGKVVESEKVGEFVYDPAITLGPFAMIGWSDTTLQQEETIFYDRQKDNPEVQDKIEAKKREADRQKKKERKRFWKKKLPFTLTVCMIVGVVVFSFFYLISLHQQSLRADYEAYLQKWGQKGERMTLHEGDKLAFVGDKTVYVSSIHNGAGHSANIGLVVLSDSVSFAEYANAPPRSELSRNAENYGVSVKKNSTKPGNWYGSEDIEGVVHRPWKMHVLRSQVDKEEDNFVDVSITTK